MSRTIAIGDIHGCATALDRLLVEIQPTQRDTVIGIGDYVDRGMETARTIDILIDLVSKTKFVPLIGNHELMMYHALYGKKSDFEYWYRHGGNATVASYGGRAENIPQHHFAFLRHCLRFYENDTHFFVHANYEPDIALAKQPDELIFWQHLKMSVPPPHENGKIAIVGHTPQTDGDVLNLGHILAIDTYCYGDQWLSAVDVDSGMIWQTNNRGDLRIEKIEDYQHGLAEDS